MNLTRFRGNVHSINGPLNVRGSKDFSHAEGKVGRALDIEKDFRTGSYPGRNSLSQSRVQMSRSIDGNLDVRREDAIMWMISIRIKCLESTTKV
jgi:hypothetical protein